MFQEKHALETPEHVSVEFEVAGPMSRYAAALYDMLIILIGSTAVLILLVAVVLIVGSGGPDAFGDVMLAGATIYLGAALLLYFPLFETFWNGQTPGKRAVGIRVMRRDMAPFGFGPAFLRHALRFVDALPGIPYPLLGIVLMTVSERALRLGDLAAGTWVVRDAEAPPLLDRKAKARPHAPGAVERRAAALQAAASTASGEGRLTEEEYRIAREFLARRVQLDPATRRSTALRIAAPMLRRLGIQSLDAERFLEEEVAKGPSGRTLV